MAGDANLVVGSADWRGQLRRNQRRTFWVIAVFVLFYVGLGLLLDLYFYASQTTAPLSVVFLGLLTLHLTPIFTVITTAIAIFSLIITYTFYDKLMLLGTEYRLITPETAQSLQEKQLYNVVEELRIAAGLRYMPRVYLIDADYMNAFASGFSEKTAFVAITRGLIEKLNREELQAVMAHELSHVRHGDIRLTMTASILSNLLLIIVDVAFYSIVYNRDRKNNDNRLAFVIILLRYLLPVTTLLLLLYLSRTREYMADAGCVELMRNNLPLANALMKIDQDHKQNSEAYRKEYLQTPHEDIRRASYLYDPVQSGVEPMHSLANLFSTHPALASRLAAIGIKIKPSS